MKVNHKEYYNNAQKQLVEMRKTNKTETENYEAQYHAYKMAMKTAGTRPYQISFDNQGGHKKLESGNFLNKISHLAIKTQPYNGKSKTIL